MQLQVDKLQSLKELILNKDTQLLQVTSISAVPHRHPDMTVYTCLHKSSISFADCQGVVASTGFLARASSVASRPCSKCSQVLARVLGCLSPSCPATAHSVACSAMPARAPSRQCSGSCQSSSHGFQHTLSHSPGCCCWPGLSAASRPGAFYLP